jgi:hypothetical protein
MPEAFIEDLGSEYAGLAKLIGDVRQQNGLII